MTNMATWLRTDGKSGSSAERRLAKRFLQYWGGLRRGNNLPLISDLNFDDIGEFVPYTFNLDLSSGKDGPKFRFIGRQLARDCGGDLANQGISQLLPQSLLARAIQHRDEVIAERKPYLMAGAFVNAEGHQVLYRGIMLPFSSSGREVDFIIGAISRKSVERGISADAGPVASEEGKHGSSQTPLSARETFWDLARKQFASENRKGMSDLIAEVSAAMCEEAPAESGTRPVETGPSLAIPRVGGSAPRGRIIVVGSEKGGTGKSTTAMNLIAALLYDGHRVGCIDLDSPQSSLSRYIENRQTVNRQHGLNLPLPEQVGSANPVQGTGLLEEDLARLASQCDFVVVDTPGDDSAISCMAHAWANIVVTPINDSFVDLDTLAVLDAEGKQILRRGHYAGMVAHARKQKLARTGQGFDWIVLRNRLSNLEARNKNRMADALATLAEYLDFRNIAGLSERVIYRELFLKGLTLFDLPKEGAGVSLSLSHVAARQELRTLVQALGLSKLAGIRQTSVGTG